MTRQERPDPAVVEQMRQAMSRDIGSLKEEYIAKGLYQEPDTFALYRIVGNDLYPRHARGQSRANVAFILEHEPRFPNCTRYWVLNRIVNQEEHVALVAMLEAADEAFLDIPFDKQALRAAEWNLGCLPSRDFLWSASMHELDDIKQDRLFAALYAHKNNCLMNNNGARNVALVHGRQRAKWVLPWDGNCFMTEQAWRELTVTIQAQPYFKYFAVPMHRVTDNTTLLQTSFTPDPVEEPQLVFRSDSREQFDLAHVYGRRPKVAFLWKLGIPGKWDRWKDDPWDTPRPQTAREWGQFAVAGWVARLSSGQAALEADNKASFRNRGRVRQQAILSTINYTLSREAAREGLGLSVLSEGALDAVFATRENDGAAQVLSEHIVSQATQAMERQPGSVADKTEVAPSGDRQDYFHPAPYWWPNPKKKKGLPYIQRDGQRVLGTIMYEPESDRYDRTRLQRLFDDGITLALAWKLTDKRAYAEHAASALRRWFLRPESRMNPHLRYSQVIRGRHGDEGRGRGIIEMKDLYYYLDAVRILESAGVLTPAEQRSFREWLATYLGWLLTSKQGRFECSSKNNHGTYYDLQVAAITAFLDDKDTLYRTLIRARSRLSTQFSEEGWQHDEMTRTQTAHYCCFNLQGWLHLASLAHQYGDELFLHQHNGVALLPQAVKWLLQQKMDPWPYEQIEPFDRDRVLPIAYLASGLWDGELSMSDGLCTRLQWALVNKPLFHPHDGIAPYWALLNPDGVSKLEV